LLNTRIDFAAQFPEVKTSMARKPKKVQAQPEAPKGYDEFVDDTDGLDDEVAGVDAAAQSLQGKLRDWRDVEKFKEERALRQVIDEDLEFDESPRRLRR